MPRNQIPNNIKAKCDFPLRLDLQPGKVSASSLFLVLIQFQAISCWFSVKQLLYHLLFWKLLDTSQSTMSLFQLCMQKYQFQNIKRAPVWPFQIGVSFSIISPINQELHTYCTQIWLEYQSEAGFLTPLCFCF